MERACHRPGKSMWASFHSSEGKRLHRNTEGGHKLTLDMVPQVASSPAGSEKRNRCDIPVISCFLRHFGRFLIAKQIEGLLDTA